MFVQIFSHFLKRLNHELDIWAHYFGIRKFFYLKNFLKGEAPTKDFFQDKLKIVKNSYFRSSDVRANANKDKNLTREYVLIIFPHKCVLPMCVQTADSPIG